MQSPYKDIELSTLSSRTDFNKIKITFWKKNYLLFQDFWIMHRAITLSLKSNVIPFVKNIINAVPPSPSSVEKFTLYRKAGISVLILFYRVTPVGSKVIRPSRITLQLCLYSHIMSSIFFSKINHVCCFVPQSGVKIIFPPSAGVFDSHFYTEREFPNFWPGLWVGKNTVSLFFTRFSKRSCLFIYW